MGTTPPTHACAVRFMHFCAETKFEKGASDRNSLPVATSPDGKLLKHPTKEPCGAGETLPPKLHYRIRLSGCTVVCNDQPHPRSSSTDGRITSGC